MGATSLAGNKPCQQPGERARVFGPVFRYFDALDRVGDFGILIGLPKVAAWRAALARRPSVAAAVAADYPALLWEFYRTRGSHLSRRMDGKAGPEAIAA